MKKLQMATSVLVNRLIVLLKIRNAPKRLLSISEEHYVSQLSLESMSGINSIGKHKLLTTVLHYQ